MLLTQYGLYYSPDSKTFPLARVASIISWQDLLKQHFHFALYVAAESTEHQRRLTGGLVINGKVRHLKRISSHSIL